MMFWRKRNKELTEAINQTNLPLFWVVYETISGEVSTINIFATSVKEAKKKANKEIKKRVSEVFVIKDVMSI